MLVIESATVPVLLSVTGWEMLGVPTITCVEKMRLEIERDTVEAAPVPLKPTV